MSLNLAQYTQCACVSLQNVKCFGSSSVRMYSPDMALYVEAQNLERMRNPLYAIPAGFENSLNKVRSGAMVLPAAGNFGTLRKLLTVTNLRHLDGPHGKSAKLATPLRRHLQIPSDDHHDFMTNPTSLADWRDSRYQQADHEWHYNSCGLLQLSWT